MEKYSFTEATFTGALPFWQLFPSSFFTSAVCKAHLHRGVRNLHLKGHFLMKHQGRELHTSLEIGLYLSGPFIQHFSPEVNSVSPTGFCSSWFNPENVRHWQIVKNNSKALWKPDWKLEKEKSLGWPYGVLSGGLQESLRRTFHKGMEW